jgi:hypothetical protein
MNTKIYKEVHGLAEKLMAAAEKEDRVTFEALYAKLERICTSNEDTDKDHPVQWEALADFTEELDDAIKVYKKALLKAEEINSKDYISSIAFSLATLQIELEDTESAVDNLNKAKISSNKIEDKELKAEIHDLLTELDGH